MMRIPLICISVYLFSTKNEKCKNLIERKRFAVNDYNTNKLAAIKSRRFKKVTKSKTKYLKFFYIYQILGNFFY